MLDLDAHLPQICTGDPDAFAQWVAGAEARLRESLRCFAAAVDTEAVLQECLLRVWQVAPRHVPDGQPNSLFRLAIRIAHNVGLDEVRRRRAVPMDDDGLDRLFEQVTVGEPRLPDPLLRRAIEACREALRGKPSEALSARVEHGGRESDDQLAARLGMRLNTFLQNVTRARKLLAECLEKRHVHLDTELT